MSKNLENELSPEIAGMVANLGRQRNLSFLRALEMVARIGLRTVGDSTEYEKRRIEEQLLHQRLDLLADPYISCPAYKLDEKFSVVFISVTPLMGAGELHDAWEQSMLDVLKQIERFDIAVFAKIKHILKDRRRLWRIYAAYTEK